MFAKKSGLLTIAHSHNTYTNNPFDFKEVLFKIVSYKTRFTSDVYIGCSRAALLSRFGRRIEEKKECYILNNGIEINRFLFSLKKRNSFRKQYNIGETSTVLAFIGRLTNIKNPFFAIDCFENFLSKHNDSYLLIAGVGPLRDKIQRTITKSGLSNRVFLLGNISNVDELLSASDVLLMPSLKEGFPVTLVEAQCSGIPCLVSNKITKEVKLSNNIFFLPIKGKRVKEKWSDKVSIELEEERSREMPSEVIVNEFSDNSTIKKIESIYQKMFDEKYGRE